MTVADRVLERRTALGLTQAELAVRMGYKGKTSVSKIETSGDDITLKTIRKLAIALNTSHAYLLGWVDSPLPSADPAIDPEDIKGNTMMKVMIELEDEPNGSLAEMVRAFTTLDEHERKMIVDLTKELAKKKEGH